MLAPTGSGRAKKVSESGESIDHRFDDLLTGADHIEELVQLHKDMTELLRSGGFNLRQCASNTPDVLETIPDYNLNVKLQDSSDTTLKTLGVRWNSTNDAIIYNVNVLEHRRITKRVIFSEIAKIFDPLGLLNPVVVTAKLMVQELWRLKLDWDESLPASIHTKWVTFASQLTCLNEASFNRKVLVDEYEEVELHGFCDASEKAYGACIYLRSINGHGKVKTELYIAKSRVAPIRKVQTIPRLELCAAVLLADLYRNLTTAVKLTVKKTYFWSDPMIVLHWIRKDPHQLKTFVCNRAAEIQNKTDLGCWNHVRNNENPADLVSRGLLPNEFLNASLWFNGPEWLADNAPISLKPLKELEELPDIRKVICLAASSKKFELLDRYSSYNKMVRILALCLRFLPSYPQKGAITAEEMKFASTRIILLVQKNEFAAEYKSLKENNAVHLKSKLLCLNPFIGEDQLIRVGGRLQHSPYEYQKKHPIILPKSHHITNVLIRKAHIENLHSGTQATLCAVRQRYWVIDGRNQVRKILRHCIKCARAKPVAVQHIMGSLPRPRTIVSRPFTNVGVDFCGPFLIKEKKFRNRNKIKVYVAVFVCLATKAVHLETVGDLTADSFVACSKRFTARRGMCASIYSDNGTNFVGANRELQEIQKSFTSRDNTDKIQKYLAPKGIIWKFNPPQSPHFGGIWEAAVKSFKHHLRRVIGPELFTLEQFITLVTEVEGILNSRPLTPMSSDPNDLQALTPSHFLIGEQLSSVPEVNLTDVPVNRLSTWQHIQKVKHDFWMRWTKEYVQELNVRGKWTRGAHEIKEGTIVIIRDNNLPPLEWRLGRVIETQPGQDGVVRTVRLKTVAGELLRGVKSLAPLPIE